MNRPAQAKVWSGNGMRQILSSVIWAENRTVVSWGWQGKKEQRNLKIGPTKVPANWTNRLPPALAGLESEPEGLIDAAREIG